MTTNYHTPITTGASANAANINAPLAELDAAIDAIPAAQIDSETATDGHVLTADGSGGAAWEEASGGDVTGPGSSTDNAIVRWNGTAGDTLQDSGITIDDTGVLSVDTISEITGEAGVTVDGVLLKDSNVYSPDNVGIGQSINTRLINGALVPQHHFRSGTEPSGFSWISDATFNGTPSVNYSSSSDYLYTSGAGGPFFYARSISNITATVYSYISVLPAVSGGVGWRVDDGSNANYYQFYAESGAGGVIIYLNQSAGSTLSMGPFMILSPLIIALRSGYSGGQQRGDVYIVNALGQITSTFLQGTYSTWTTARSGIYQPLKSGAAYIDWLIDNRA